MRIAIHQPNFIPYIGYFDKMSKVDKFVILDDFEFTKPSFIYRNKIRTPDGWMWLTIPNKGSTNDKINEVRLDGYDWIGEHKKSIKHMYSNTEYYDMVKDILDRAYDGYQQDNHNILKFMDTFNFSIIVDIVNFFGQDKFGSLLFSSAYNLVYDNTTDKIIELCKELNADTYLSGISGKNYLNKRKFKHNDIELEFHDFDHPEYEQVFDGFEKNMSIIDYMMNEGDNWWY